MQAWMSDNRKFIVGPLWPAVASWDLLTSDFHQCHILNLFAMMLLQQSSKSWYIWVSWSYPCSIIHRSRTRNVPSWSQHNMAAIKERNTNVAHDRYQTSMIIPVAETKKNFPRRWRAVVIIISHVPGTAYIISINHHPTSLTTSTIDFLKKSNWHNCFIIWHDLHFKWSGFDTRSIRFPKLK